MPLHQGTWLFQLLSAGQHSVSQALALLIPLTRPPPPLHPPALAVAAWATTAACSTAASLPAASASATVLAAAAPYSAVAVPAGRVFVCMRWAGG